MEFVENVHVHAGPCAHFEPFEKISKLGQFLEFFNFFWTYDWEKVLTKRMYISKSPDNLCPRPAQTGSSLQWSKFGEKIASARKTKAWKCPRCLDACSSALLSPISDWSTHVAPSDLQPQTLFRSSPRQRSVEAGNEQKPDAEVALKAPEQQRWLWLSSIGRGKDGMGSPGAWFDRFLKRAQTGSFVTIHYVGH